MTRVLGWLALVLVACVGQSTDVQINQALWVSKNVVNYDFTVQISCFCPVQPPTILEVRAGVLVRARFADGSGDSPLTRFENIAPFERLFDAIRNVRENGGVVTSKFDAVYGFPTSVSADPVPGAVDDEFFYTITDFKPV